MDFGLPDQIESLGWKVEYDEEMPVYEQFKPVDDPPIGKLRKVRVYAWDPHLERRKLAATLIAGSLRLKSGRRYLQARLRTMSEGEYCGHVGW